MFCQFLNSVHKKLLVPSVLLFITIRNSSCRKVMFSQASVILSTGRGMCGGAYVAGGHAWQRGCAWLGGGDVWQGACMAGETVTTLIRNDGSLKELPVMGAVEALQSTGHCICEADKLKSMP